MPIVKVGQLVTISGLYMLVDGDHTLPSLHPVTSIPGANSWQFYLDNDIRLMFPVDFSPETATRELLDGWITISGKVISIREDNKPNAIEVEPETIRPYICPPDMGTPEK